MAAYFATAGDYLQRLSGLLDAKNGPATIVLWVKFDAAGAGYHTAWTQLDDPGTYLDWIWTGSQTASDDIYEGQGVGGAFTNSSITPRPAGTWMHLALVRTSVTGTVWMVNGKVIGINNRNMLLATLAQEFLGNDTFSDGGVTVAYLRQWSTFLTTTQILDEMQSPTPVITANLWGDWPFTADILDASGNGRDWTQVGSTSFVAGPTLPGNGLISAAASLSSSATISLDFGDGFVLWYTYTPIASTEDVLSAFAIGSLSDTIEIETFGTGLVAYPYTGSILADNKPIQIPLLPATPVYVRLFAADHLSAAATLRTELGPTEDTPLGTILINDDTGGFPLALISPTTGLPLRFMNPFPIGEQVAVLTNGGVLLEDSENSQLLLIDPSLVTTGSVPFPWGAATVGALNSDRTATFYASAFGSAVVYRLDSAGAVVASYTLATSIGLLCPSRDDTILYYINGGTNQPVHRWDLVNNVALADLAAGVASHFAIRNPLVLADGTLLVAYGKSSATADYFIRRYDPTGTILNTYALADPTETINWIQIGVDDDGSSFLVWSFPTRDVTSRFTYLAVADGSVISETPVVPIYEGGVYQPSATLTPDSFFGHSKSCPIWVLAVTLTQTGVIQIQKITDPSGSLQVFQFTASGGLTPATFSLVDGQLQIYDPVVTGSGYAINETPVPGWTTLYVVSNGSPISDIFVGPGETVTITVTNTQPSQPVCPPPAWLTAAPGGCVTPTTDPEAV